MAFILFAVSDSMLKLSLRNALEEDGHRVILVQHGRDILPAVERRLPDLLVVESAFPPWRGPELCRVLRQNPGTAALPVLLWAPRASVDECVESLYAGADDFVRRPVTLPEVKARVHALLQRAQRAVPRGDTTPGRPKELVVGRLALDLRRCQVRVGDREPRPLTPTEMELLRCLMEHPDEVLSRDRLLRDALGYRPDAASSSLVRWHIRNLRSKVEPDPGRPRFLRTVHRHGFLLDGDALRQP